MAGTGGFVDALRLWVREIVIVLFLAGALEMLLPEAEMKRFARVAVGFFVVLAVGKPILAVLGGGFAVDRTLAGLASWDLGTRPGYSQGGGAAYPGGGSPLDKGAEFRRASRDRALAADRAALESQIAYLATREEGVADARAEVDLVSDPSSPGYGSLLAVRLTVWMAPRGQGVERAPEAEPGTGAGLSVAPVRIGVAPVVIGGSGAPEGPAQPPRPAGSEGPAAVDSGTGEGYGAGTPAGDLARRLRSVLILLLGVPPGGITIEVWP